MLNIHKEGKMLFIQLERKQKKAKKKITPAFFGSPIAAKKSCRGLGSKADAQDKAEAKSTKARRK